MRNIILVICLFIIVSVLVFFIPNNGDYIKTGKLYISEIVSSNNITIKDNMNESSDYIEIYNGYDYDINLEGYYLSDSEFDIKKWILPDVKIKSKEYLVIYASSLDTCDLSNRICHTNFNLSSQGEIVTLSDNNGNIISKVKYPKMDLDISYSYYDRKYILTTPTPYKKNSSNKYSSKDKIKYNIKITEYMTHNNRSHYDIYGNYYDWIEIYNEGEDVSLKNMYVSDDKSSLLKYKLPDITIKKGEYKVIYFNKDTEDYKDGIYVNFGLSDNDKNIVLSSSKEIVDIVDVVVLKDDMSYGLKEGKWQYFLSSTPGRENTTQGFDSLGGNNGNT